jgi:hypothetical protein
MRKGIILTLPQYDIVTEYLSAFSSKIEKVSYEKGIFLKSLKREEVNKKEFEKIINKLDCKMIVFNGHGNESCIAGNKEEVLVKAEENEHILKNRIVYARSCEAASTLGKACVEDSDGCFIGYVLPFEFYFNQEWITNPIKDNTARLFLESSNVVPISIIKGSTSTEANERSKKKILKNIKKVLRSKTQESFSIAESLWNNYLGQVLLGNKNLKL